VRSSNRSARIAELSLLANLRPVLVPSRLDDTPQKVGFADDHRVKLDGGTGEAQTEGDVRSTWRWPYATWVRAWQCYMAGT
jgi:hypothetical protein